MKAFRPVHVTFTVRHDDREYTVEAELSSAAFALLSPRDFGEQYAGPWRARVLDMMERPRGVAAISPEKGES